MSKRRKIVFIGAGSFIFTRSLSRDILTFDALRDAELWLVDINPQHLEMARRMVQRYVDEGHYPATVHCTLDRREALPGADGILCTIQVGGWEALKDELGIPSKYGIEAAIGDTRGVWGFFCYLRTIQAIVDIARDVQELCPDAVFLNYTNPMAMLTGAMLRLTGVKTVGLCHSVQVCAPTLLNELGIGYDDRVQAKIAGINHQAWLLECARDGVDLYPEIKRRALLYNEGKLDIGGFDEWLEMQAQGLHEEFDAERVARFREQYDLYQATGRHPDMVRLELMRRFGYYVTESSEHNSEYTPWFIKERYPELIERFNIPLDEYPRRCVNQIAAWKARGHELTKNPLLKHTRSREYASYIMEAMETNVPTRIGGNVLNRGLITNLPSNACVEVPCLVDRNGVQPTVIGDLPEQCAALNRTNINVQLLAIEAARTMKKDYIYQAVMLDPHAGAELSIDDIVAMCDELIEAHGGWLPKYH